MHEINPHFIMPKGPMSCISKTYRLYTQHCTEKNVVLKSKDSCTKIFVQLSCTFKNRKNDTCDMYQMILKSPKVHTECLQEQVGEERTPLRFG